MSSRTSLRYCFILQRKFQRKKMSEDIPDKKIREQFWELDRDGLPKFKKNEITITRERLRERPAQMTARKGIILILIFVIKKIKICKNKLQWGPLFCNVRNRKSYLIMGLLTK